MKVILSIVLILLMTSCFNRSWKREKEVNLSYQVEGIPVYLETEYALIKFDKHIVIRNLEKTLRRGEQYDTKVFLNFLKRTTDTIRLTPNTVFSEVLDTLPKWAFGLNSPGDTIVLVRDRADERNYYAEPMSWAAYDLIRDGKCEIFSKVDSNIIKSFSIVYNHEPINTEFTEFYFDNDTMFFYALTLMGL